MQSIGFVSQRQPDAVEQLKAIWRACFDAEEEYLHLYFSTRYRPDQTLVLEEDGQILGMLTLLPCTLRVFCQGEWRLYRASYLFAVGTHLAAGALRLPGGNVVAVTGVVSGGQQEIFFAVVAAPGGIAKGKPSVELGSQKVR